MALFTAAEVDLVATQAKRGRQPAEIARKLPGRSTNSIRHKLRDMRRNGQIGGDLGALPAPPHPRDRYASPREDGMAEARLLVSDATPGAWREYFRGDLACRTDAEGEKLLGQDRARIGALARTLLGMQTAGLVVLCQRRLGEGLTAYLFRRPR